MNADSVKARLKNYAVRNKCTFQDALVYYGLERTIYRISISKYSEHFVLKGGILLYALYDGSYLRATTDIDLLAEKISNSGDDMRLIFRDIFSLNVDDALVFDLDSIVTENITEFKEYHGIHVSAVGYLDRTKIPVDIDIGFGDVIFPEVLRMNFPVILDMESPSVNVYSLESSVAEKIEAIIRNGYLNSRYKDFYDIYVLSEKYEFSYERLSMAVRETFENRKTEMTMNTAAFGDEFLEDPIHQTRWFSFLKKKKALVQVSLADAVETIKTFIKPVFEDLKLVRWNPEKKLWE
jgi:predicted nucleotidyltransferase component of viral defense system